MRLGELLPLIIYNFTMLYTSQRDVPSLADTNAPAPDRRARQPTVPTRIHAARPARPRRGKTNGYIWLGFGYRVFRALNIDGSHPQQFPPETMSRAVPHGVCTDSFPQLAAYPH